MSENHEELEHPSGYEKEDTNVLRVTVLTMISIALITICVVTLYSYFINVKEEIIYERELKPVSPDLIKLKTAEADTLQSYILLDSTQGRYLIPIDRAMELVVKESSGTAPK